jgi:hypothetical protein
MDDNEFLSSEIKRLLQLAKNKGCKLTIPTDYWIAKISLREKLDEELLREAEFEKEKLSKEQEKDDDIKKDDKSKKVPTQTKKELPKKTDQK